MYVKVVKTIKGYMPMTETIIDDIVDDYGREGALINLRPNVEYQEFDGFGGAFTESASTTLDKLSKRNREKILLYINLYK